MKRINDTSLLKLGFLPYLGEFFNGRTNVFYNRMVYMFRTLTGTWEPAEKPQAHPKLSREHLVVWNRHVA